MSMRMVMLKMLKCWIRHWCWCWYQWWLCKPYNLMVTIISCQPQHYWYNIYDKLEPKIHIETNVNLKRFPWIFSQSGNCSHSNLWAQNWKIALCRILNLSSWQFQWCWQFFFFSLCSSYSGKAGHKHDCQLWSPTSSCPWSVEACFGTWWRGW